MGWYWQVTSDTYGTEEYGPYNLKRDAVRGIARVKVKARQLGDNVIRCYSAPYKRDEEVQ